MSRMTRSAYGLEVDRDNSWRHYASCGPAEAEWFWLLGHKLTDDNRAALELCSTCPVTEPCLASALADRRYARIAGGMLVVRGVAKEVPCAS